MKWGAVGVVSVLLAAILLAVFVPRHRAVSTPNPPWPVLVAKQLIPKGTPGSIVVTNGMYGVTAVPPKEVEGDGIADLSYLRGRAAVADILPGQQLTAADFTAAASRG